MSILKEFKKIENRVNSCDKISIAPSGIFFPSEFVMRNNLGSQRFADVYTDTENRRIAFVFNDEGIYKLKRQTDSPNFRYITLSKRIIEVLEIGKKDFKQYVYEKHIESGKEFFLIQLEKEHSVN